VNHCRGNKCAVGSGKRKPPSNSCCEIPFAVASRPRCSSGARGRKGEPIVHRARQILLAANVSFGGLHGGMSQQELDLLQFAARSVAQSRAGPPQGVGANALIPTCAAHPLTTYQTTFWAIPSPKRFRFFELSGTACHWR
jgi:hypothetical protein